MANLNAFVPCPDLWKRQEELPLVVRVFRRRWTQLISTRSINLQAQVNTFEGGKWTN